MLCDRDAVPSGITAIEVESVAHGRLKVLKRYDLENYFRDEHVRASIFHEMEPDGSWLSDPLTIREKLKEVARPPAAYVAALLESAAARNRIGYIDVMPKGVVGKAAEEVATLMADRVHERAVAYHCITGRRQDTGGYQGVHDPNLEEP